MHVFFSSTDIFWNICVVDRGTYTCWTWRLLQNQMTNNILQYTISAPSCSARLCYLFTSLPMYLRACGLCSPVQVALQRHSGIWWSLLTGIIKCCASQVYIGQHSITTMLIRTPHQLFEEIMLSEVSACEANWVSFFCFHRIKYDIWPVLSKTHTQAFSWNVSLSCCDGFRLTKQQTSKPHQDLCFLSLAHLLFPP